MEITAELVKTLRDKTNCGFMDCKKALKETAGDLEAAVTYLRQKGIAVATKRAERATSEGTVWALLDANGTTGVLLEVNCESDFVAKTEAFQDFGKALAAQIAADAAPDVDSLLARPWQAEPSVTVALRLAWRNRQRDPLYWFVSLGAVDRKSGPTREDPAELKFGPAKTENVGPPKTANVGRDFSRARGGEVPALGAEDDGALDAWEILGLDVGADLAVCSAVEWPSGTLTGAEGITGFSWAWLAAGTPTVVTSRWTVPAPPPDPARGISSARAGPGLGLARGPRAGFTLGDPGGAARARQRRAAQLGRHKWLHQDAACRALAILPGHVS